MKLLSNEKPSYKEFVFTWKIYHRKGLVKAICITDIEEAFKNDSKIITLRSMLEAKEVYRSMGFKSY